MQPFNRLSAIAAPIDGANIDTDRIIPARFLRKPRGDGYHRYLFHDVRFADDGTEVPDFVLNRVPFRTAPILVADSNFGCGSSREGAVYALADHGIRAIVAPSFGDIFHQNCVKNGLLPIRLPAAVVADWRRRLHEQPGATITIDLPEQSVTGPDGAIRSFDIDAFAKTCLVGRPRRHPAHPAPRGGDCGVRGAARGPCPMGVRSARRDELSGSIG